MTAAPAPPVRLGAAAARRLALAAQGFTDPAPTGRIDRRHLRRTFDRVGLVQIDSVNIVARSHELPVYARLGPYPRGAVLEAAGRGELFEYWGHEASFIPVEHHPYLRHKMEAAEAGAAWGGIVRFARANPGLIEDVHAEIAELGPRSAGELSMSTGRKGPWWGWNDAKLATEWLFWCGRLAARRRPSFEREYGLPTWFIPDAVLATPTPAPDDQRKALLLIAARCLGVGTAKDLADYHRLNVSRARPLLEELVQDGRLLAAEVEGWRHHAYLHPDARVPRTVRARALLSPFDSLVWERDRALRLFGFHYRLEFYTPAPRRTYGYYVMPFLLGDTMPARVDLKADRKGRRLAVLGAFAEAGVAAADVAEHLAAELRRFAAFLDLDDVTVRPHGDLAGPLADRVQHSR
ncbi:MAG: winged helix-turn-helix domain-containing protein [Acidimicrobiia bacterium]